MDGPFDRQLLFVTGKGGVGKTTVAASLALLASQHHKRVLLCDAEGSGDIAASFETSPVSFVPRQVSPGLWAMSMDTEASLREYIRLYLHIPVVSRLGPLARAFDFVAAAAPGVKEILVVGKICWEVREANWDLVVVDSSSSGHIVSQLSAAETIGDLVSAGPIRQQAGWMMEILSDPARTGVVVVTTPEEMPVNETIELTGRIRAETKVDLAAVVVNRVLPELFGRAEEEVFDSLCNPEGAELLKEALGEEPAPILAAARLAVSLRRNAAAHLARLRGALESSELIYVPYLFARASGTRATHQVAAAIGAEIGW